MKKLSQTILLYTIVLPSLILAQEIIVPNYWNSDRPYWDMPTNKEDLQAQRSLKKTLEYQLNPFFQPNEIYGKETCHGGGSYDDPFIGQSDVDAANTGIDHFALDATGDNIINSQDGTEIQNYLNKTISYLQSHWNFLTKDEKLSWFTKMANIYTVDQKQYIDGDENTRYISGNYATEFILRLQGYDVNKLDIAGGTRKPIPDKYSDSFDLNGRPNIPVYFGVINKYDDQGNIVASHGMNFLLTGAEPRILNNWKGYEPQGNIFVNPGDWTGSIPFNSQINIYKLENFGGSSWGEDMPSRAMGDSQETTKILTFGIDSNGNESLLGINPNLLTTKPTVAIGREANMPKSFSLGKNYPNPFNPTTTISYSLINDEHIFIKIFDLSGKEIETLFDGFQMSGEHKFIWQGANYPSGIYFYQLSTENYSQTKKMVLMK